MVPRLPAEIWTVIVEDLPRTSQRSCLFVSRLLHDIAIRPLFSVIRLYLRRDEDRCARDILDRIVSDKAFATLVKSLVVIADRVVKGWELAKAIESMSQLVSFQWVGRAEYFSEGVAEAIASFCPRLRELALPVDGTAFYTPLLSLHNLRALRLSWAQFPSLYQESFRFFVNDHHKFDLDDQLQMIDANQNTLQELHIMSRHLDKVPVRVFGLLTHLEIHVPYGHKIDGLPFVLRHAVHLESLILMGPGSLISLPFDTNTETLPSLSSLHLSIMNPPSSLIWQNISDFIRGRVSLQRIYLRLGGYTSESDFHEILSIIKDLPALRVLGLKTIRGLVDLEFLALHLPPTLESFQLILSWNKPASSAPLHRALPNLTFLHLLDPLSGIPITAQELAHDMKHLRTVGSQWSLWDIVRVGNDEILLPSNLSDSTWRAEGRFSDDGAWLLKYL